MTGIPLMSCDDHDHSICVASISPPFPIRDPWFLSGWVWSVWRGILDAGGGVSWENSKGTGVLSGVPRALAICAEGLSFDPENSKRTGVLSGVPRALAICAEGLSFDPDDAELLFRKVVTHRQRGEAREAEAH